MTSQQAGADAWTATSLVLIAIGAVLALLVIWWGARLKRQRHATKVEMEERAEEVSAAPHATTSLDDTPPPAPETNPVPVVPPSRAQAEVPVAPPPLIDRQTVADRGDAASVIPAATAPTPAAEEAPVQPTEAATSPPSPAADDLTRMKGVGPKLAARLAELGVTSFAQIAALSPAEATALDAQLGSFQGRMMRDRWVEQAGYLARDDRAGFEAAFGRL